MRLHKILVCSRLIFTVSLVEGDTIRATVDPQKASDTEDNALTTPLTISRASVQGRITPLNTEASRTNLPVSSVSWLLHLPSYYVGHRRLQVS